MWTIYRYNSQWINVWVPLRPLRQFQMNKEHDISMCQSIKFRQGDPDSLFTVSNIGLNRPLLRFPFVNHTSISKVTYSHLWFSRGGVQILPTPYNIDKLYCMHFLFSSEYHSITRLVGIWTMDPYGWLTKYWPQHEKTGLCCLWPTKAQTTLWIVAVRSAPLLFAIWKVY